MDDITFTQRAVHYAWAGIAKEWWFHAKDPVKSAQMYLEKHRAKDNIKLLEMPEIESTQTLAFIVDDFMHEWVQHQHIFSRFNM